MPTLDDLSEECAEAVRQAVAHIHATFDPWLVVVAGSIVRGNGDARSDLDVYVLHDAPFRQRIQRWFNGVAVEIFVNPEPAVDEYMRSEALEGQPSTAHMIATGVVVHGAGNPRVHALRRRAARSLVHRPSDESTLVQSRYGAATLVEDALDRRDHDPATAMRILSSAVEATVLHWFKQQGRHRPRNKDVLPALSDADPRLGDLAHRFWGDASAEDRWTAALELVDAVLGTRGFFEWASEREAVDEPVGGNEPTGAPKRDR